MKSIDIKTTQNVTITYELAHVRDRIIACIIDQIIMMVTYLIIVWFFSMILSFSSAFFEYAMFLFALPFITFYTLGSEFLMHGQTLGKKAMKIKVIKLDGRQPEFYDYLNRWVFRLVDVWLSLGVIASILIASSDFSQRLGDITSNTTVVRVNNRSAISLNDILRIDTRENYIPTYTAISNFRDEDILLIKQTIDRYNRYRNAAHKQAILVLCENLRQKLGLENPVTEHIKFLKTLIKDYIVLTR